jgi:hypothetical protein
MQWLVLVLVGSSGELGLAVLFTRVQYKFIMFTL